ncbi:FabD/lysophospholipase-like protein, partial [Ophiobolus disseminans]
SIDGGGIRGYSSLLILQRLVEAISECETKEESEKCPDSGRSFDPQQIRLGNYFNCIYGASTGGIIATMLGRLNMTVTQCLEVYQDVGRDVFGHKRLIGHVPFVTKYAGKNVEDAAKQIVKRCCTEHGSSSGEDLFAEEGSAKRQCETICVTASRRDGCSHSLCLLRTHSNHGDILAPWLRCNGGSTELRIWEVIRATSAAPFYFHPFSATSNGALIRFKDGGILANNPAQVAWDDHQSRYSAAPALLLSIGTGKPQRTYDGFSDRPGGRLLGSFHEKLAIARHMYSNYTSTEITHQSMLANARGEASWYKRLNPPGLGEIALDEWKRGLWRDPETGKEKTISGGSTISKIEKGTEEYLRDALVSMKVSRTAMLLVRRRRMREA